MEACQCRGHRQIALLRFYERVHIWDFIRARGQPNVQFPKTQYDLIKILTFVDINELKDEIRLNTVKRNVRKCITGQLDTGLGKAASFAYKKLSSPF